MFVTTANPMEAEHGSRTAWQICCRDGAGSNIGWAIALTFAREGAALTLGDIDAAQTSLVVEEALAAGASSAQFVSTDVTDHGQVTELMDSANAQQGRLDVLVNGVGWDQLEYFTETTPELWQRIIQLNYVGVLNCTSAALKHMVPAKAGSIVSISSDASRQGEPREAVYGGTKAAINSFMKTITKENGRLGIRCNVVCPGVTIPVERRGSGGEQYVAGPRLDVHAGTARKGCPSAATAQGRAPAGRRERRGVPRLRLRGRPCHWPGSFGVWRLHDDRLTRAQAGWEVGNLGLDRVSVSLRDSSIRRRSGSD